LIPLGVKVVFGEFWAHPEEVILLVFPEKSFPVFHWYNALRNLWGEKTSVEVRALAF